MTKSRLLYFSLLMGIILAIAICGLLLLSGSADDTIDGAKFIYNNMFFGGTI